jgi:hypothetical protein
MDIRREFRRIDGAAERERFRFGGWRWAAAGVAAALVVLGVFYQLRNTPSVKAASILKKAVAAAESRPATPRRIRIRTRTAQITRVVQRGRRDAMPSADMQALFQAAHYDSGDPLSARAYQLWRDGLGGRERDEVAETPDYYRIRTTADEGELASASLTLRAADLEPVEGRLEFRNREWVEMSEIPEPSTTSEGAPVADGRVEVPMRPVEPSRPAAAPPGPSASISDELQVLAALHQIGADLGDPVEVKRSEGRVVVGGTGVAAARQRDIREALAGKPNVAVEFSEPSAVPAEEAAGSGKPAGPAKAGGLQARVEKQLGGRAEFERVSSQLLDWNEAAMARAYALRALARRFQTAEEAGLASADRGLLRDMARDHTSALAQQAGALRQALTPILLSLGGSASAARTPDAREWQTAAERLFESSRRVEVLLSVLLGVAPDQDSRGNLASDLLTAIEQWQADLAGCTRLLSLDSGG